MNEHVSHWRFIHQHLPFTKRNTCKHSFLNPLPHCTMLNQRRHMRESPLAVLLLHIHHLICVLYWTWVRASLIDIHQVARYNIARKPILTSYKHKFTSCRRVVIVRGVCFMFVLFVVCVCVVCHSLKNLNWPLSVRPLWFTSISLLPSPEEEEEGRGQ